MRIRDIMSPLRGKKKVENKDVPVLIRGENGSVKEVIAKVIHANSERKRRMQWGMQWGQSPLHSSPLHSQMEVKNETN